MVALVLLLLGSGRGLLFAYERYRAAPPCSLQLQGADPTGEAATAGRVEGQVPLVAQQGAVLLPHPRTQRPFCWGRRRLEVVLQVALPVESLLTISTLGETR